MSLNIIYKKTKFTIGDKITEDLQEVQAYMSANNLTELSGTSEEDGLETTTTIVTDDFTLDDEAITEAYFTNADTDGDGIISEEEAGNIITGINDGSIPKPPPAP